LHNTQAGGGNVFHADSEGELKCIEGCGFVIAQCHSNGKPIVSGRQDYQWKHEPVFYGWKEGIAHNWYSDRKQNDNYRIQ
jgi:hypothetical protein